MINKRSTLFFTKFSNFGGTEKTILLLCQAFLQKGLPCIVTVIGEGRFKDVLDHHKIPNVILNVRWYFPGDLIKVWKFLISNQFDVIFLHHVRLFAVMFRVLGLRVIQRVNLPQDKNLKRWGRCRGVDKFFDHFIDSYIAVSEEIREGLVNLKIKPEKIVVIRNGVDMNKIEAASKMQKFQIGVDEDDFLIGSVGRLEYQKGFDLLIHGFCEFQKKVAKAKLLIIGSGSRECELKRMTQKLAIGDKVVFFPYVENPYPYLKTLDLFVLSSRWEGLANTLLEAMACRCPILASDCEGTRDAIENGVTGMMYRSYDIQQMTWLMGDCLQYPLRWRKYAEQASVRIIKDFPMEAMIDRTLAVFQSLESGC